MVVGTAVVVFGLMASYSCAAPANSAVWTPSWPPYRNAGRYTYGLFSTKAPGVWNEKSTPVAGTLSMNWTVVPLLVPAARPTTESRHSAHSGVSGTLASTRQGPASLVTGSE